ncbi:MAG: hypothetical protein GC146_13700 [Limimaricola sp.]|uniref:hypothetical protein n=1 Tax=Limimaricola sp. TaxID=2211665 RepID=UPI001DBBFA74|nr:hypothetical protein [Limimaricola sp.]MBI1418270.1 hypothetical protein [Limimaricola sp.]
MIEDATVVLEEGPLGLVARIVPGRELALAQLVRNRPAEEVAELLPRIFAVCSAAQALGVRMALGLPTPPVDTLLAETLREHLTRLCLTWPDRLGLPPGRLPHGWQTGAPDTIEEVIGAPGLPPPSEFAGWLRGGQGTAAVLAAIDAAFAPFEAVADLPAVTAETAPVLRPCDNSLAARHAGHPLMAHVAETRGKGPLWRALGRVVDLVAAARGDLPAPVLRADGWAIVPAARGLYAVRGRVVRDHVSGFERRTPTDHLLAPGGVLEQSIASLSPVRAALAPLLVDILDPCIELDLKGMHDA